jgi:putative Mn2+ efflux pump MntP
MFIGILISIVAQEFTKVIDRDIYFLSLTIMIGCFWIVRAIEYKNEK